MSMPPPGPPPAAPPPPQPAQDLGWLRLTLQGSPLTSNMITPAVSVNGYRVPAKYGDNVIPVHPGHNRVDVSCQWLMTYGQASLTTEVPPGGQVPVFYAAPMHQFSKGAIGYERQKRPGVLGFWLLMVLIIVAVCAVVILPNL